MAKPTWNRRKDLFVDVTPLESRKSTPDRFIQYRLGSFVENSPGLVLGDGDKLPDI